MTSVTATTVLLGSVLGRELKFEALVYHIGYLQHPYRLTEATTSARTLKPPASTLYLKR
jgi:hypothetical protein